MRGTKMKVATGAVCGATLSAGVAYAAIPAPDGSIKGCYATTNGVLLGVPHSKGDLRLAAPGEVTVNCEGPVGVPETHLYGTSILAIEVTSG
jgi:hypothetical protein